MAIKVNENNMIKLMELTENKIKRILNTNYYLDDTMWGEDMFSVCVMKDLGKPQNQVCVYRIVFAYDEADYLERDVNGQFTDWLKNVMDNLMEMGVVKNGKN